MISGLVALLLVGSMSISAYAAETKGNPVSSTVVNTQEKDKPVYTYGRLSYVIEKDNTVTIVDCKADVTWATLVGEINGHSIGAIGEDAFKDCTKLQTVTLDTTIKRIGSGAFQNTALTTIEIPYSVKSIASKAFGDCKTLKTVRVNEEDGVDTLVINKKAFVGSPNVTITGVAGQKAAKFAKVSDINFKADKSCAVKVLKEDETEADTEQTTQSSTNTRVKYIKGYPEGLEDSGYSYHWDDDYYYFDRSGIVISRDDYTILCNCVANEYGADWVPEWEMGLVAEVVFNRYNWWGYSSIRDVIVAPYQFEGSANYAYLDGFSYKVNDRVISAVNTYLSFPEYFNEGYTSFRGDGTWNWFW